MMRRRDFIGILAAGAVMLAPRAGEAQQPTKIARIGYLSPLSAAADSTEREAFRQGLRALGYVEGQNAAIEARYADGRFEKLPGLGADLVRLKVDVIVAAPTPAVRAAQQATQTIPIVMAFSACRRGLRGGTSAGGWQYHRAFGHGGRDGGKEDGISQSDCSQHSPGRLPR